MSKKTRLDVLLVTRGLQESRQKAQATIMSGLVYVNGQKADKPGTPVAEDAQVEIRGGALRYVSRGGLKLEKAMALWPIRLTGKVCMDVGASTGGFTDCMLQNGAARVYAVDVGYGQLAWKLRSDERVVCLERTNARYLSHEIIPEEPDFASIDVSFISLKLILPAVASVLRREGEVVCLIKPQFEAGREKVGKKGVVRDPAVHREVLERFLDHARARWRMVPSPPKAMRRSAERSSCCSGRQATPNCHSPPSGLKGRQYTVSSPTDRRMPSASLAAARPLSR